MLVNLPVSVRFLVESLGTEVCGSAVAATLINYLEGKR